MRVPAQFTIAACTIPAKGHAKLSFAKIGASLKIRESVSEAACLTLLTSTLIIEPAHFGLLKQGP